MILLEHYIDIKIFHLSSLKKYDVVQTLWNNAMISFKVMYNGQYVFTLVVKNDGPIRFELSHMDRNLDIEVDWELYSKVEAALIAVYLNQIPS